jgi:hypothetical protein
MCDRSVQTLEHLIRLTRHPDDHSLFEKGGSQIQRERTGGRGKPPYFDRLRWRKGERGSRGEMRRLRAKPEVPMVVGAEGGRDLRRELARRAPLL